MTSILFLIETIEESILKCIYLGKKNFSEFVSAFMKPRLNFEHFQTKYDPQSWCISKIMDSEKRD